MHMHVHGKLKAGMCVTSKEHVGLDIYLLAPNRSDIVIGGGAPERGNPPEGGVATLPTTSAGLDCGNRGS